MTLMIDRLDFKRLNAALPQAAHDLYPQDILSAHTPAFELTNVADLAERMDLYDRHTVTLTPPFKPVPYKDIDLRLERFPNVAPPFRSYWMEWRPPAHLDEHGTIGRFGVWCVITDDTDDTEWVLLCALWINAKRPRLAGRFRLEITKDGHALDPGNLDVRMDVVDTLLGSSPAPAEFR